MEGSDLVFICGCGRSGTTLYADLLGMHSEMAALYETEFVQPIARLLCPGPAPQNLAARVSKIMTETNPLEYQPGDKCKSEAYFHDSEYLRGHYWGSDPRRMRDFFVKLSRNLCVEIASGEVSPVHAFARLMDNMFRTYRSSEGKRIVVNKTPNYADIIDLLAAELYPKAKVIHIVRHGHYVARSYLEHCAIGPDTLREAADFWVRRIRSMLSWGEGNAGRYLETRYENLVRCPALELQRILKFIGVGDEAASMLNNYGYWRIIPSPQQVDLEPFLSRHERNRLYFETAVAPMLRRFCYETGRAKPRYYVCGSWNHWVFEEMECRGEVLFKTLDSTQSTVGFQIVKDLDWNRALYPAGDEGPSQAAGPGWRLTFSTEENCCPWTFPTVGAGDRFVISLRKESKSAAGLLWVSAIDHRVAPQARTGQTSTIGVEVVARAPHSSMPSAMSFQCVTPQCPYLMHPSEMQFRVRGLCCGGCPEGGKHGSKCSRTRAPPGTKKASSHWHEQMACYTPYCRFRIHSVPFSSRWPPYGVGGQFRWHCCTACGDSNGREHSAFCESEVVRAKHKRDW